MKARYTDTALTEVDEIFSLIAADNPLAAESVVIRVQELLVALELFPEMGHRTDEPGVRVMPIVRYPYVLFYTVRGNEIVILHVRHSARLKPWE